MDVNLVVKLIKEANALGSLELHQNAHLYAEINMLSVLKNVILEYIMGAHNAMVLT